MRLRPIHWFLLSLLLFAAGAYVWHLADKRQEERNRAREKNLQPSPAPSIRKVSSIRAATVQTTPPPMPLLSAAAPLSSVPNVPAKRDPRFPHRVSNTAKTVGQLARSETGLLLENALIDTSLKGKLQIPDSLRAKGEHGSYIVQARGAIDAGFRELLNEAGAKIISYIPQNAYLVRVSSAGAQQLAANGAQAVLAYEPYFKLKPDLLRRVVEEIPLPADTTLNVVVFPGEKDSTASQLEKAGVEILGEDRSPFGPVLRVRPPLDALTFIANLAGVQTIETAQRRIMANDLSRARMTVSSNTIVPGNYLELTGSNIVVAVNDTGVDESHQDLTGRVFSDVASALTDTDGHGTHVAGIIAGDGTQSVTVSNASGSINPGTNFQYRGKAPGAHIFASRLNLVASPFQSDAILQEAAAGTNALISNNSWHYAAQGDYNLAAASYDAAVRDSLPEVTGSQSLLYVFAAGNGGFGGDDGLGGEANSIFSPGTAKNVITVGAVEQLRKITNVYTANCTSTNINGTNTTICDTNQPWLASTDTSDQIAAFSSRGNVGVGIEGDFGRFKPDVVAPGTFVVSTRSTMWDEIAYYNRTNFSGNVFFSQVLEPNELGFYSIFVPDDAVQLFINVFSGANLPIYVSNTGQPTNAGPPTIVTGINSVSIPPDAALSPIGTTWFYTIQNTTAEQVTFDVLTILATTNAALGNYFEVLSNLNNSIACGTNPCASGTPPHYYRYESGSSMAAAAVSGTLALMEQFFTSTLQRPASPALMKALLINGARGLGDLYDFQVQNLINFQGWGLVQLTNSIPTSLVTNLGVTTTPAPFFFFDQSPTNALATGQSQTRTIQVNTSTAPNRPLRVTLVWTDPPGNPAAGIKLVNDLDLVVTNLDTGEVFFGNDMHPNDEATSPWDTNEAPNIDIVNNVENVYLAPPLGTNYSITVTGKRVNVNAVTAHPDDVVQDYALVISSGNGVEAGALALTEQATVSTITPNVTLVSSNSINGFDSSGRLTSSGAILLGQRVGANTPLLGTTDGKTNQWHFYVIANTNNFTNAAFAAFLPTTLSIPRMGVRERDLDNATRIEADIDMFIARGLAGSDLTNLSPTIIADAIANRNGSRSSRGRAGAESIVLSDAANQVFYIGIKSEDYQAAEYGLFAIFSEPPFSQKDENGNLILRPGGLPAAIPDGSPESPQAALLFAFAQQPLDFPIRRVIVTNHLSHERMGDLLGNLSHSDAGGQIFSVLNNHSCVLDATDNCLTNVLFIYEDNGQGDIDVSSPTTPPTILKHTDGPGSLTDFIGQTVNPGDVFMLTMVDNAVEKIGSVNDLIIKVEPQMGTNGATTLTIGPGGFGTTFVDVGPDVTNMTVSVAIIGGAPAQPLDLFVRRGALPTTNTFDYATSISPPGGSLTVTPFDVPPLRAGRYFISVFNPPGNSSVTVRIVVTLTRNIASIPSLFTGSVTNVSLRDDAVTYAEFDVSSHLLISALDVGLLIRHPRISDLAVTLISPNGTRILLFEDRGRLTADGLGSANGLGTFFYGYTNMAAFYTNDFDASSLGWYAPGAVFQGWNVLTNFVAVVPDYSHLSLNNNVLMLTDGVVSNSLPTTNSTNYRLTFKVNHAPYIVGMAGWWPFDEDATDIFGGHDGLLSGNVQFSTGEVNNAFIGDGVATSMKVPACPDLDVGMKRGFTIEGWINPISPTNTAPLGTGPPVMSNGFENAESAATYLSGAFFSGWVVDSGDVDVLTNGIYGGLVVDSGTNCIDLKAGTVFTNVALIPGRLYQLSFAYARNPDSLGAGIIPQAAVSMDGAQIAVVVADNPANTWMNVGWQPTSVVFTATSPLSKLELRSLTGTNYGVLFDSFEIRPIIFAPLPAAPLVGWDDPTNALPFGVHFWFAGLPGTNVAGSLAANILDTNSMPHIISTPDSVITNGGWQHVALSYDNSSGVAKIYTNGQPAVTATLGSFTPLTSGDLFFGYHPVPSRPGRSFAGGLDEFSVYERALSDCEIATIAGAASRGKYGTNVLTCPVVSSVELSVTATPFSPISTFFFTNGLSWVTNGPFFETNFIDFTVNLQSPDTNSAPTNLTSLVVRPLDPNVSVDDFVLSALLTNSFDGLLHFTEDRNLAVLPIKFAPTPFSVSNFPPVLIFSNDFENATAGIYTVGSTIPGGPNNPAVGTRDWTVTRSPVTVVINNSLDATGSNFIALARGAVSCELPTAQGHRYELTYNVRGPGAVSWWNGEVDPLSRRARDLIGGNNGAFFYGATNSLTATNAMAALVGRQGFYFDGASVTNVITNAVASVTNFIASKIELGDPQNLRFTNAFTIEGWINPSQFSSTNEEEAVQLFFRGDSRNCLDPYWLALEKSFPPSVYGLLFHVEGGTNLDCGLTIEAEATVLASNQWQHIAAVFEGNFEWTNSPPSFTNVLRLYVNGQSLTNFVVHSDPEPPTGEPPTDGFTPISPFRDLDPAFSPGVSIGNRSRYDSSEPYSGFMDELTVYDRALTAAEIAAIANAGAAGKSDPAAPPSLSLAKVRVLLDNVEARVSNGDNAKWSTHTLVFTARQTNTVLTLESLLPGTLVDNVTLTEIPAELHYLPEESLNALIGEDAFGRWRLEILDTRVGATSGNPELVNWQLQFTLAPSNPPPVIHLQHGINYINTLPGNGIQYFVVDVPQWATMATNILLFATNRNTGATQAVNVLFSQTNFPTPADLSLFGGPVSSGVFTLMTNTSPALTNGQPYYLEVVNPQPTAVRFAIGVSFDILTLTNCESVTSFVGPAGIPRYFQFDIPTNPPPEMAGEVTFWLTSARSNLTVVLSQHLPLPNLGHYDYISQRPCTNDEVLIVLTNSTPWPIMTNRWYVGVFNSTATNVPFTVTACYTTNPPTIIPLTNATPFFASQTDPFAAPPGPPRFFFFEFDITNSVDGVLFELYNLSGDADLVLQRDVPPGQTPYFAGSFQPDTMPEQIVLRTNFALPDLRGRWFLGVYNNEPTNTAYTIRAVVETNSLLVSTQPLSTSGTRLSPRDVLLQWNSIVGETYNVEFTTDLFPPITWTVVNTVVATTPTTTFLAPVNPAGNGFYRIVQVP